MNRLHAAFLLMLTVSISAYAQEQTPAVLLHAAQCLSTKDFLAPPERNPLSFGYSVDSKSYSGKKVVYVVLYTSSDSSQGDAFTVLLSEFHKQQVFNITNNGSFLRTRDGVKFTNEPLGGIWTHEHLVSAIKQIERKPRFEIPVMKLRLSSSIRCEAYTDNSRSIPILAH